VLDLGGVVLDFDIGERVGATVRSDEQRVAAGGVPGAGGRAQYLDEPAVGVLGAAGRDPLGDDGARRVPADVDHLRAGVGLLAVCGDGHRVELADRVVALQDDTRVLPGDRRSRLHLGPGDLRPVTCSAPLGHEVVDAAAAVGVTGVPVLHGRVLDRRVVEGDELHDRRVQLVLVAFGCGAAFQVADRRPFLGNDEGSFELPGLGGVDPEVGRQLHRASHAGGNEAEGPVGEHRGVQGGEEVVCERDHRSEVLADQIRSFVHRLGERAEDDAHLGELLLERGRHGDRVHDCVRGNP
jgi:hypothetical protein